MIRCDKLASKKEVLLAIGIEVPVEVLMETNTVDSVFEIKTRSKLYTVEGVVESSCCFW